MNQGILIRSSSTITKVEERRDSAGTWRKAQVPSPCHRDTRAGGCCRSPLQPPPAQHLRAEPRCVRHPWGLSSSAPVMLRAYANPSS